MCNKGYAWNPSNCECECDKSCDFDEYLDYENCKCGKRLVDKLVEECGENVDEAKLTEIALAKMKIVMNVVLALCILCYFGYCLQLTLVKQVLILFIFMDT